MFHLTGRGGTRSTGRVRAVMLPAALFCVVVSPYLGFIVPSPTAHAQEAKPAETKATAPAGPAGKGDFIPAINLLPESIAGLVRVPDVPAFRKAWPNTNAGKLLSSPAMKPFLDSQRDRAKEYLQTVNNRIGITLKDIYDVASGEAVFAWLPFKNDRRRPFSMIAVADVRNNKEVVQAVVDQIDKDLKSGGWSRTDSAHGGETIRVYANKPKPGQLKIEQIAICLTDSRLIASDRDRVVVDLIDAVAGKPSGLVIAKNKEFQTVLTRATRAIRQPAIKDGGTIAAEWFARPFEMARIVREVLEVDRGNRVDLLGLFEDQGFDAIKAAGGIGVMAGKKYDILHKGYVLAPLTAPKPKRYKGAAQMLQLFDEPMNDLPAWLGEQVATFNRLHLDISEAFWGAEPLVNAALEDDLFRVILDEIRDDEGGPQVDIVKDLLPNLDDQVLMFSDNLMPADVNSERILVALRIKNIEVIKENVQKWTAVEPDASLLPNDTGVKIWVIQRGGEDEEEDFGVDLFDDFTDDEIADEPPPLLDRWAIAVVEPGPGSKAAYLMASSHPELLVDCIKRVQSGQQGGFAKMKTIRNVHEAIQELGGESTAMDHYGRSDRSIRVKYELLRQKKLKESDSVVATLLRRAFEQEEDREVDGIGNELLPPLKEIEDFFPTGGGYLQTTEEGWSMTGFFLND